MVHAGKLSVGQLPFLQWREAASAAAEPFFPIRLPTPFHSYSDRRSSKGDYLMLNLLFSVSSRVLSWSQRQRGSMKVMFFCFPHQAFRSVPPSLSTKISSFNSVSQLGWNEEMVTYCAAEMSVNSLTGFSTWLMDSKNQRCLAMTKGSASVFLRYPSNCLRYPWNCWRLL